MSTGACVLLVAAIALACSGLWAVVVTPRLRGIQGECSALVAVRACSNRFCRAMHRVQVDGLDHLEQIAPDRGVLLVANHTSAIDPFLLQVPLDRFIHWMMARDMMVPVLDDLWELVQVVPVDRDRTDSLALRRAMRLLRTNHIVGLFPEGRITRPTGTIRPFLNGVGLLATRAGAPVLPVLIDGTPERQSVMASMIGPSRARLRILQPMSFDRTTTPEAAAKAIRLAMSAASGWPLVNEPMPLEMGWATN